MKGIRSNGHRMQRSLSATVYVPSRSLETMWPDNPGQYDAREMVVEEVSPIEAG